MPNLFDEREIAARRLEASRAQVEGSNSSRERTARNIELGGPAVGGVIGGIVGGVAGKSPQAVSAGISAGSAIGGSATGPVADAVRGKVQADKAVAGALTGASALERLLGVLKEKKEVEGT